MSSSKFEEIFEGEYEIGKADRYMSLEVLGEGTFGTVRKGIDRRSGKIVAIKYIRVMSKNGSLPKAIFREMQSLKQLCDCTNIIHLHDVYVEETCVCLVTEYAQSDLSELITSRGSNKNYIPRSQIKTLFHQMLRAVDYCHANHIIHRDIKPANLLLTSCGVIKLADFGLARIYCATSNDDLRGGQDNLMDSPIHQDQNFNNAWDRDRDNYDESSSTCRIEGAMSHQVATRHYRAPELLFASRSYDYAVDMWSLAVVMFELLTLQTLFPGSNDIDQMFRVFQVMGSPTPDKWPGVQLLPDYNKVSFTGMEPLDLSVLFPQIHMQDLDFASLSLRLNPSDRISAHTALIHPYFIQKPVGTSTVCLDVPVKGEVYRSSGRDGNQQQQDHNQKKKTVPVIVNNTNDFLTLVDSMFA